MHSDDQQNIGKRNVLYNHKLARVNSRSTCTSDLMMSLIKLDVVEAEILVCKHEIFFGKSCFPLVYL